MFSLQLYIENYNHFKIYKFGIVVVPALWCSQDAADLEMAVKFLSCKGIFDPLCHIKNRITTVDFTTKAILF